ncbi:MAG TPA: metallophosphoesterase [bacterium]|nr:metallophosphoesterase [bacterium]
MKAQFLIFIAVVISVLALASVYVGWRMAANSTWIRSHSGILWFSFGLFLFLQILGPYLYRVLPDHQHRLFVVHWAIYMALGVFACVFFYTLAADALLLLARLVFGWQRGGVFGSWGLGIVVILTLFTVVVGVIQTASGPRLYDVEVPIPNLPEALDGFRIVQVSDLHVGPTIGREYAAKVVAKVNDLRPDLVALTGDLIDGTVPQLQEAVAPLSGIRSIHGMFYVPGNHEYYWGVNDWLAELKRLGAHVLVNAHEVILRNGAELTIAGVTDDQAAEIVPEQALDVGKAASGAPEGSLKILLSHRPTHYEEAARNGFRLQLSGHTHGGQFFPWSLVVAMAFRFEKGLHRYQDLWVYVSRGTGYWGPPIRFGVPPELTLLRLKRV